MKDLKSEFSLPIKGLIDGMHQYSFQLTDSFFDMYTESLIRKGSFGVILNLEKKPSLLVLDFEISGHINVPCDRCLKSIDIPIEANEQYLVKYADEDIKSEEVIFIQRDASEINVADMMYEMIQLRLPLMNVKDCEAEDYKDCDEGMLDYIDREDTPDDKEGNDIWGDLKNIKLK